MINITKTYLPSLKEYNVFLRKIWEENKITNNGPLVKELEKKLKKFLGVKHLFFVSNGTIGLQIAIRALGLTREIITTPFSYVATTSSIVYEGCQPVFVDIDPETLNIDVNKIETKITGNTQAILATHIYGNPCSIEGIRRIVKKHHLKLIFDAAHTFGGKYKNKSIASYGDISVLSFHATKIFHTVEGGAIITNNVKIAHKISYLRNFGHKGEEDFYGLGINGKNSEFHAAMGLSVLPKVNNLINKYKKACRIYDQHLRGINIVKPKIRNNTQYNYAYYPLIFSSERKLKKIRQSLNKKQIFPRRYFYPSLNKLNYVKPQFVPIAEEMSKRVLCLPLSWDLKAKTIKKIVNIIKNNL